MLSHLTGLTIRPTILVHDGHPPQRPIQLSLIITYDQEKGENHFKFKYLTNRSLATLAKDAERLDLPRYKGDYTLIVTSGRALRITWKDVAENSHFRIQLLDLVKPIMRERRRQWEQTLEDLRIEDVKLDETIMGEKPYAGSSKRSAPSQRQRDRQNYEQYDDVNPSFSERRAHSRTGYGSTIHSWRHDSDLTATPFAHKRPSPTSLADRVESVALSEKPERISLAPAAHFRSLSERINARDPSPIVGGSLSALAITRKSSQETATAGSGTATPLPAGPLPPLPITPRHSKDASSSSRFGPPVDLPPISTKAVSPTASSRQATPGSARWINKLSAQTQSSLPKDTFPTDNATLDGAAAPRVAAEFTQLPIPPPHVEELLSHEAYASTEDEAEDNRVKAALLTPTTTSTVHEVVEPQDPIVVTEGVDPSCSINGRPCGR
ncbi:hypothetical protein BDQ17DRAFT_1409553 [Cyathus striatus]|nr:hypothetical protein BDQ17DRAFT_1409553 [Cyathus striatus]